ncbi:CarD family transcriptional regulator [Rickettsiales bacterium]|nr:CarD family transcriptional regulator [Rickettsiales bacterium]
MSETIEFKAGDKVVYPAHGVGEVTGEETQTVAGMDLKVYVVQFEKDKMVLRVPVGRANDSGLRALCPEQQVDKAMTVLKGRAKPGRGMWSRRAQEYEGKINSGDVIAISEVVRDLYKNVDDPDRSYSERVIYESALARLASEFAAVKNISAEDAMSKLVTILKARRAATKPSNDDNQEDVAA